MSKYPLTFSLIYKGNDADQNEIDFYDVSRALVGFQRSLALTTHLLINDELIIQAPSLKNAQIIAFPSEEENWKITAAVVSLGVSLGVAPSDSAFGHLVYSAYDYVINETLGMHVDYEESLGKQYEKFKRTQQPGVPILGQERFDSLMEKCEVAIREMHRPIYGSETAESADIVCHLLGKKKPIEKSLTIDTYNYIKEPIRSPAPINVVGRVSSYNTNTFKGRIYVKKYGTRVPFELMDGHKEWNHVSQVLDSLVENSKDLRRRDKKRGFLACKAFRWTSRTGQIKGLDITSVDTIAE